MDREKAILAHLVTIEGDHFQYDEEAIINEYASKNANQSGIAIKILSVFGGFVAMLAFMGFLAISGLFSSEVAMIILGLIFTGGAIWINKFTDNLLFDTFSVSIFIAGISLFAFGLLGMDVGNSMIAILVIIIGIISLYLAQNYILAFLSVMAMSGAFFVILLDFDLPSLFHIYNAIFTFLLCYWILFEAKIISVHPKLAALYNPIKMGLIISLLMGLVFMGNVALMSLQFNFIWLSTIVNALALAYIVHSICTLLEVTSQKTKFIIYGLSSLIILATVNAPAISGAIIILLLSFLINDKVGFALGVIALIYFISQYYYDLNLTLLTKSIILFFSGLLFLGFYFFTNQLTKSDEKI